MSALPTGCMEQSKLCVLALGCMVQSELSAVTVLSMNQSEESVVSVGCSCDLRRQPISRLHSNQDGNQDILD